MQIEVSPSGQRVTESHNPDVIEVDIYDAVIGKLVGIDVDGVNPTHDFVTSDVRLLRVNGNGRVYGIRVSLQRRELQQGKHHEQR